jgi:hypothetical protein
VLDALHHWLLVERDPADKAMIAKLLASASKLDADRESEIHDAIGASPALKLAIRANRP